MNFLNILEHPYIEYDVIFQVMSEFRKGGLNPDNVDDFIKVAKKLPPLGKRKPEDYLIFESFNLKNITEEDFQAIFLETQKRVKKKSKICWHPKASNQTCINKTGNVEITKAHTIQNKKILETIHENHHVSTFKFENGKLTHKPVGRNEASVYWAFCNTHDQIFYPIENQVYEGTLEQNFLFAYRGFIASAHPKFETSKLSNFGDQAQNDILRNKAIFDNAIINESYDIIVTKKIELPNFYPLAVSSSFYLDFDFEGNEIPHSDERMENIYLSVFPLENKTIVLISYFKEDQNLYDNVVTQLNSRENYKSDISMLISGHVENVYFNPTYFKTFIESQSEAIMKLLIETQYDYIEFDKNGKVNNEISLTPSHYLSNKYNINLFCY